MNKKFGLKIIALLMCVLILSGCAEQQVLPTTETTAQTSSTPTTATTEPAISFEAESTDAAPTKALDDTAPKYIFLFIGDGMSFAQVQAAQIYKGSIEGKIEPELLNFSQFPAVGLNTTYDTGSYIPDSAAAGTAIACGVKTEIGTIGMEADDKTEATSIAELLKADGKKIGIVTSTSLNHATPAAFYAHVDSRGDYYDIATQMAQSGFDYFGGGGIYQPTGSEGDKKNAYTLLEENGYTLADSQEEIEALGGASGKVYAVSPVLQGSAMLPFAIDAKEGDLNLADFVRKGIDVLDNENGFFMMCEGGKIDPACHANDAATAIHEVLAFEEAVQEAVSFMGEHPDETLIIITADHETGGMGLGYTLTQYDTSFELLQNQKASYLEFNDVIADMQKDNPNLKLNDMLPVIKEYFGLKAPGESGAGTMTSEEYARLKDGFAEAMKSKSAREDSDEAALEYGGYNPLTVTLVHILAEKAGIGWTTFYHTAALVPVYAAGADSELFSGAYDDTDIFNKLVTICGLE
jgi:alkaline phosphatase